MRTTGAASPVRLVAQREIRLRVRSKAFKIATLLLVLVTVGGGLLARSLNTDAETRYTVVVVGTVPAGFSAALAANADQLGVEIVTTTATDQAAATAEVSSGAADAALVLGGTQPVLVWETEQIATLQAAVVNALQVAQIQQQAAALGLSSAQVSQLLAPPQVDEQILEPPDPDRGVRTVTGYAVAFVLTFILNLYGSYILLGVVEEKSTSVVEVLLAHVAPRQLLAGKVLGLGVVALVQVLVLVVAGGLALVLSGASLPGAVILSLPTALVWFLLGFALYATVFAVAGSLVSRQEDAQSVSLPIASAFIFVYLALGPVIANPDSTVSAVLSLLPPLTPFLMPARVAAGDVPFWQPILGVVLVAATIVGLLRIGGRIYAATLLHSGAKIGWRQALKLTTAA